MNPRLGGGSSTVPVLMYHSIAAGVAAPGFGRFVLDPAEFAAQLDYLDDAGYQTLTAAELSGRWRSGQPLPARPVVLTFDDAFADFYTTALPMLAQHRFRATVYVPTGYVGASSRWMTSAGEGSRQLLSWSALRDIAGEGVEVASHSHSHPQLDRVPAAQARDEVRRSRSLLEDRLGLPVDGFAYPFGYWNRAARAAVASAGFRYACAVSELPAQAGGHPLTVPRLTVNAGIGVTGLSRVLESHPAALGRQAADAKRLAWRALRRTRPGLGGDPREGWPA